MSDHLPLNKCKRLKALGMPQEIVEGDRFWYINRNDEASMHFARENELLPAKHYRIPSLETIMEFAKTLTDKWTLKPWAESINHPPDCSWVLDAGKDAWWVGDNLDELFYALIDKVGKV